MRRSAAYLAGQAIAILAISRHLAGAPRPVTGELEDFLAGAIDGARDYATATLPKGRGLELIVEAAQFARSGGVVG